MTLEGILADGFVRGEHGDTVPLHSNTSLAQCRFLQGLIGRIDARHCLEVGLAFGISSLAICETIAKKEGASLISIDPLQTTAWQRIGLLNLERAGFGELVEFHESPSFVVLPSLVARGERIQFAYVDSVKVFDMLLVDAFYLTRLLDIGGIMVFDDCDWPGVRKLVRYLTTMPHLRLTASFNPAPSSLSRRIASTLASFVPSGKRLLNPELIASSEKLGMAASCVAFEKIAEDSRPWDWYAFR